MRINSRKEKQTQKYDALSVNIVITKNFRNFVI